MNVSADMDLYEIQVAAGITLGLEVAPLRRDKRGACRGLLVSAAGAGAGGRVARGDEIFALNGIRLSGLHSEAALNLLQTACPKRLRLRRRGRGGAALPSPPPEAPPDEDEDADEDAARFADGPAGLRLLPARAGGRCGGLALAEDSRRPDLRAGDVLVDLNGAKLGDLNFGDAIAAFRATTNRRCRVRRA
eukprot:CAMPEP_0119260474 /NCGR_PEP_ID=MMETSP1329-20130426/842_1 /TAXON_ID=114041 /ORGANISM="Genus nov. species nov., Strain RCC1024" /LENGTH=190 /DNA_ID=CAMNT_0007259897 /DNA_START=115 /DNA_END=683 /DNA_ORIENTATION=+